MDIFLESDQENFDKFSFAENDKVSQKETISRNKEDRLQILPCQHSTKADSSVSKDKDSNGKSSSKRLSSIKAGRKSRERKKQYQQNLEFEVKQLESQIYYYEQSIKTTKEALSQAMSSSKNNQNSVTFLELVACATSEDPNEDKINLLLDMIKYRIGASGRERQAKIEYYFKQLVNTLFPALHRYLMYTSEKNSDIFELPDNIDNFFVEPRLLSQHHDSHIIKPSWTSSLLQHMCLTYGQKLKLNSLKQHFFDEKQKTKAIIAKLAQIKSRIRQEEDSFEEMIDQMRNVMRPVQSANFVIFGENYKYKRLISFQSQIQLMKLENPPSKKMKLQQD